MGNMRLSATYLTEMSKVAGESNSLDGVNNIKIQAMSYPDNLVSGTPTRTKVVKCMTSTFPLEH